MSTDRIRNELQRLIEAVVSGTIPDIRDAINSARTALSEPADGPAAVAGQPSDEELGLIYHDVCRGCEFMGQVGFEDAARAVLARWGRQPAPPAEGEVACISIDEMCEILRSLEIKAAEYTDCTILYELTFEQLRAICDTRAFALLAQWLPAHAIPIPTLNPTELENTNER